MFSHSQKCLLFLSAICLAATAAKADVSGGGGTYYTNFTTTETIEGTSPINVSGTFTVDKWGGPLSIDDFTDWNFTFTLTEINAQYVLTPADRGGDSTFQFLGNPSVASTPAELSFQGATRYDGFHLSTLATDSTYVDWSFRGDTPGLLQVTIEGPSVGTYSADLLLSGNAFTFSPQETTPAVPEPSSAFLLGIGGLCVGASSLKVLRRRENIVAADA